jgi:hypothetical protein
MPTTQLNQYRLLGDFGLRLSSLRVGTTAFGEEWDWDLEKQRGRDARATKGQHEFQSS